MNKTCLLLAITCATFAPLVSLQAGDAASAPMTQGELPTVQQLENVWRDTQLLANKGAASHGDVLAARIKLAEARIHEEQLAIVSARKEQVTRAQQFQKAGAATEADVSKASVALQEALLAIVKD